MPNRSKWFIIGGMSKSTKKLDSDNKKLRTGLHSAIAFLALAGLVAAAVVLLPRFGIAGRGANRGAEPSAAPVVPTASPSADPTSPPASTLPSPTPKASDAPVETHDPSTFVKTDLIIDGERYASLASRQAAEELISAAVSHFELLCPGTGLLTEVENRIEYADALHSEAVVSFDDAFSALIGENSPLRVRTVFTRSDLETLPCASVVHESAELYEGTRCVASYGRDGKKLQLHEYTYINGVLSSLSLLEESLLTEPVDEEVLIGTRPIPTDFQPSRDFGFSECPSTNLEFRSPFADNAGADVIGLYGFYNGEFHRGIDFSCPTGSDCYATCGGTVSAVLLRGSMGLIVEISHGGGFVTRYCNLQSASVSVGDTLLSGGVVGKTGEGGLRLEIIVNGTPRNPLYYFGDQLNVIA